MSSRLKLAGICFAAAFALAACGGGGGGVTSMTPSEPPPMEQPTPAEQLAAAEKAVADAEAAVAAATTAAEHSAAYSQLAMAEQALAAANALPENVLADLRQRLADAESDLNDAETAATNLRNAVSAINAARTAVDGLGSDATADDVTAANALVMAARAALANLGADDAARLEAQVGALETEIAGIQSDMANAAMVAAATKAAGTKRMAIAVEASQGPGQSPTNDDAGLGGSAADGSAVDTYSMTISRDRSGTKIEIADAALADDDDPKFAQAADLGHGRTMHVRTKEADDDGNVESEVVVVMTDIEAPTATAFAMVAGQALNARDLDDAVDADEDGTATNDWTALTVDQTSVDVRALVKSASFAPGTGDSTQHTFSFDDASTTDMDEADEVAGTYNGAMGTYRCNGTADCTVTVDDEGAITAMSDGWVFTPNAGATSDVPDADYLNYGFWLKRTTDSDGAVTYNEVETFAGSSIAASGGVTNVEDTATYEGGAVGVYVIKTLFDPNTGELIRASSGHFKADASLMARFGGDNIAVRRQNQIEGTIDNFVLSGEEENSWSVALQGVIAVGDGTATGTASGGVEGKDGSFRATFHGPTTDGTDPIQPHSVVGEFNADFVNGAVAGGFGARKTEE